MLEVIRKRRSIRSYLAKDVEEEKIREVLKAAMFAPSSRGGRAWEFIVIRNDETRVALSKATPYAFFIKDAPVAIAVCYNTDAGMRFKEDAAICAEHIHLEAVNQGLASFLFRWQMQRAPMVMRRTTLRDYWESPTDTGFSA